LRLKVRNEFIPINLFIIILIVVIFLFPTSVLRIILALPLLLFFPGYVLLAAAYPRRGRLEVIERIALSFGISIVIVPVIGLILNYSPWGLALKPSICALSIFTFITSFIAWLRRRRLPESEKLSVEFHLKLPSWDVKLRNRVLQIVLACAILGAVGVAVYTLVWSKAEENFTEFYILNESGEIDRYPRELNAGTTGYVKVDIINRENRQMTYNLAITLSGEIIKEVGPIILRSEEKWEEEVSFTPERVGENQKMEFLLYRDGESEPYQLLHLWINVKEGE
jgi:uncharacterized membrane protein